MKSLLLPWAVLACLAALFSFDLYREAPTTTPTRVQNRNNPEELGDVNWTRDFDAALLRAAKEDKPVFLLFQEVPGCSNCTRFGQQTLSHPLIVEAIETLFVPVAVYNNEGGRDAEVLARYGEPSWNNPVVRIVAADGNDLVPRMPDFRSTSQVTGGMIAALERIGVPVPQYVQIVHEELLAQSGQVKQATFETSCFWSGEGYFGQQPGVVGTEAGWQGGAEVVRITYDASRTDEASLEAAAAKRDYGRVGEGRFRLDREPKYYLGKSSYAGVPMTELQATRANALLGQQGEPRTILSPRQLRFADTDRELPSALTGEPLRERWAAAERALAGVRR